MSETVLEPIIGFRSWSVQEPRKTRALPKYLPPDTDVKAWLEEQDEIEAGAPEPGALLSLNGGMSGLKGTSALKGGTVWHGPVAHFACPYGHAKPTRDCGCGLYAVFSPERATWGGSGGFVVTGAVIAWGHIVMHGNEGFRAEHMRIVALAANPMQPDAPREGELGLEFEPTDFALLAGRRIGVPVVKYSELKMHAREHGRLVVLEYRYV